MKPKFSHQYKGMACRVYLVREHPRKKPIELIDNQAVYELVKDELISADREVFISVLLDSVCKLIGIETVHIGALNCCIVSPREVFKSAILANAASIVVCHNHPSGSLKPSSEDIRLTDKLVEAGILLDIRVQDHLIITHEGYASVKNR